MAEAEFCRTPACCAVLNGYETPRARVAHPATWNRYAEAEKHEAAPTRRGRLLRSGDLLDDEGVGAASVVKFASGGHAVAGEFG